METAFFVRSAATSGNERTHSVKKKKTPAVFGKQQTLPIVTAAVLFVGYTGQGRTTKQTKNESTIPIN